VDVAYYCRFSYKWGCLLIIGVFGIKEVEETCNLLVLWSIRKLFLSITFIPSTVDGNNYFLLLLLGSTYSI
jgi:hypothetical protein